MALPEHAPQIPHIPIPDVTGRLRWALTHWKPVGLALATFAGGTYLALAHDRGPSVTPQDNTPASDTFKPPEGGQPSVGIVPPPQESKPTVEPTTTAEAQKPTPTPEAKVEAYCGVVDPEYRQYAEVIEWKSPRGLISEIVGFRFPPNKKISIKAAMNGQVAYTEGVGAFRGTRAVVSDPNNQAGTRFEYYGNLIIENKLSRNVSQGEDIGYTQAGGIKVIEGYDYDLIIYSNKGSVVDEEALQAACPEAFEKPAVPIALNLTPPPATYTDVFIPRQR